MQNISRDILDKAEEVARLVSLSDADHLNKIDFIAEALMAERERGAKVADDYAKEAWGCIEDITAAEIIAGRIRAIPAP